MGSSLSLKELPIPIQVDDGWIGPLCNCGQNEVHVQVRQNDSLPTLFCFYYKRRSESWREYINRSWCYERLNTRFTSSVSISLRSRKGFQWLGICWVTLYCEGMAATSVLNLRNQRASQPEALIYFVCVYYESIKRKLKIRCIWVSVWWKTTNIFNLQLFIINREIILNP